MSADPKNPLDIVKTWLRKEFVSQGLVGSVGQASLRHTISLRKNTILEEGTAYLDRVVEFPGGGYDSAYASYTETDTVVHVTISYE
jgi:hypothetical protein